MNPSEELLTIVMASCCVWPQFPAEQFYAPTAGRSQVRTGLPAGGKWIQTFSPTREEGPGPTQTAPLAYIGGSLGTLIRADLLNLGAAAMKLAALLFSQTPIASRGHTLCRFEPGEQHQNGLLVTRRWRKADSNRWSHLDGKRRPQKAFLGLSLASKVSHREPGMAPVIRRWSRRTSTGTSSRLRRSAKCENITGTYL
jgi:hypothetical protein